MRRVTRKISTVQRATSTYIAPLATPSCARRSAISKVICHGGCLPGDPGNRARAYRRPAINQLNSPSARAPSGHNHLFRDNASGIKSNDRQAREGSMGTWGLVGLALAVGLMGHSAWAQINVGVVTSLSGPISSIGIPYGKGIAAGLASINEISGQKVNIFQLDDASDPSAAARAAHKLIDENKVDIILGAAGAPPTLAVYRIAY